MLAFHALILNLPIQTSLSVVPKLQVSLHSGEKCGKFRKTSTSLVNGDTLLPFKNRGDKFPSGTLYRSTNLTKPESEIQSDAHADADTAADTQYVPLRK